MQNCQIVFFARCLALLIMLEAFFAPCAEAGDATVEVKGTQALTWSSNPLMLTQGAKSLTGSTTTPEFTFKDSSEGSALSLNGRIDENVFDQASFNSTDLHEAANLSTQNERWAAALQQSTDYDTTRTSELTSYGVATTGVRHLGLTAAPQITYSPTASDTILMGGAIATSHYASSAYTDYETFSANPTYTHHLNAMNTASLSVQAQRYQTTRGPNVRNDTIGPQVGWGLTLNPRLSTLVSVGVQDSRQYHDHAPQSPWVWHNTFSGGLTYKGQRDTVDLLAQRAQFAYGNGTDALQTSLSANASRNFNPILTGVIKGSYLMSDFAVLSPGSINTLISGSAGLTYHVTERLDVSTSYQYRRETIVANSASASDHSALLNVSYHPKVWTLTP